MHAQKSGLRAPEAELVPMKIAVSGKGGVGKTTIAALLATALAQANRKGVAVDAAPDPHLAACRGNVLPSRKRASPPPDDPSFPGPRLRPDSGYGGGHRAPDSGHSGGC